MPANGITEYHIMLDYRSEMFKVLTHSQEDMAWVSFNSSASYASALKDHHVDATKTQNLTDDIVSSRAPYDSLQADSSQSTLRQAGWADIMLAANTRSQTIPALLHINGDKGYLEWFWPNMWFWQDRKALLKGALNDMSNTKPLIQQRRGHSTTTWWKADGSFRRRGADQSRGMWIAKSERLTWKGVCKRHETSILTANDT